MTKLIIDATNEKIFFILINNNNIHIKEYENSKNHYEKFSILINQFLEEKNSSIKKITLYMLIEDQEALQELETHCHGRKQFI